MLHIRLLYANKNFLLTYLLMFEFYIRHVCCCFSAETMLNLSNGAAIYGLLQLLKSTPQFT